MEALSLTLIKQGIDGVEGLPGIVRPEEPAMPRRVPFSIGKLVRVPRHIKTRAVGADREAGGRNGVGKGMGWSWRQSSRRHFRRKGHLEHWGGSETVPSSGY